MARQLIFILFCSFSLLASGQNKKTISGLVKDKNTGEPLIGANVVLLPDNKGISTDVYGFYSLETESRFVNIKASYVGYRLFQKEIEITGNTRLDIYLEPGIELGKVDVVAQKPIEERLELGVFELPVIQVKNMPMLGEPDVLKAMQLLPGVQGGSDGRSGLYIRGGSPDQNLFMLDGSPMYYVNHLGGFVSVFHPDILKNIKLYKGSFPARFGGRLSSVIDLRMKEGNKKEFHGSYGIGLVSGDLTLEGPIIKDKTSYIVSIRRMWIDFLLRPITKIAFKYASLGYNFYDFYGKVSHEENENNRFYFSLYGGDDHLGFYFNDREERIRSKAKYTWGNVLSTIRWNHIYNEKSNSDITLHYTRYRYFNNLTFRAEDVSGKNFYSTAVHDVGVKADFNWYINNNYQLRYGGGTSYNWFIPGQIKYRNEYNESLTDTILGTKNKTQAIHSFLYLENEYHPFNWFSANAGFRISYFNVEGENYFSVEPRIITNFLFNKKGSIKIGYTEMMQPVHMLTYSGSTFPTDIWLPSSPEIPPAISSQYSVGYAKTLKNGTYQISVDLYSKKMKQLIEIKGGVPLVNTQSWDKNVEKNGTGSSKGIELMLQKKQGITTGWLSYTLSKSDRKFENIDGGKSYPFKYDRRHDFSVVVNYKISSKVNFSATWIYGSGYPTTLQNGTYLATNIDAWGISSPDATIFEYTGEAYLYPGKNWLRMRDYHRLDLGLNFTKERKSKKEKLQTRTWTVGIYNAYNRQNAVFYYYAHEDGNSNNPIKLYQQSGFPIIPTVKYSVKF